MTRSEQLENLRVKISERREKADAIRAAAFERFATDDLRAQMARLSSEIAEATRGLDLELEKVKVEDAEARKLEDEFFALFDEIVKDHESPETD